MIGASSPSSSANRVVASYMRPEAITQVTPASTIAWTARALNSDIKRSGPSRVSSRSIAARRYLTLDFNDPHAKRPPGKRALEQPVEPRALLNQIRRGDNALGDLAHLLI